SAVVAMVASSWEVGKVRGQYLIVCWDWQARVLSVRTTNFEAILVSGFCGTLVEHGHRHRDVHPLSTFMIYRVIILGPQGCGKGTQAALLATAFGIPQITPGAMYRAEIARGTEWGQQIVALIDRGEMAPNDITIALVRERLGRSDCTNGFILDGFPRDLEQVHALDGFGFSPTHVIGLQIGDSEAIRRLADRWICVCGKPYAGQELPLRSGEKMKCAACNGKLFRRPDDEPVAIRRRLEIYHERTEPVLAEYRRRGVLIEIDGERPVDVIQQEIRERLGLPVPNDPVAT
ncbi:MAG: nucleoside monophosphate kinase, partial [Candidatus Uhrbacteria bacterium]